MATWLDFSGSPALLVPKASIHLWHGIFDPKSGEIFDLNPENPRTDYDRACKAAWSGTGIISIGDNTAVVLYSEEDTFAWFPDQQVIASGNWVPEPSELATASWGDPVHWYASDTRMVLLNAAANAADDLREEDYFEIELPTSGHLVIEFTYLDGEHCGWFHRIRPVPCIQSDTNPDR